MGNSTSPENIVLDHLIRNIPERSHEIKELWSQHKPKVVIEQDKEGVRMREKKHCILFSPKDMDLFWLIGFSGWKAIECYSPHVVCASISRQSIDDVQQTDTNLDKVEIMYKQRLSSAQSLKEALNSESVAWPCDIPRPSEDRNAFDDLQYKAAFDLTCLAVAFIFFHEFRHVMFSRAETRPRDRREEELQCDVWAREMMTAKISRYVNTHNHQYQKVLQQRSMGIALAALILHEITPYWALCGNQDYFSIKTRLVSLLDNTRITDKNDHFWVFSASLLVGIYRRMGQAIDVPVSSAQKLTNDLLNNLQMD